MGEIVRTVSDLVEALKRLPPGATVWTGCLPKREYVEVEQYDAEHDVVRIVGPCDGDEP